ncbi:MAG: NPCBM/NEW2 domain-containing protein [Verrucomicrobiota bacterium]
MSRARLILALTLGIGLLVAGRPDVRASVGSKRAISIEGIHLEGEIGVITREGAVTIGDSVRSLDELREIVALERSDPGDHSPSSAPIDLYLVNGTRLTCLGVSLLDEQFQVFTEILGEVRLPIDLVRAARFRRGFPEPRFMDATASAFEEDDSDRFFLIQPRGEVLETNGFVEEIETQEIVFERGDDGKLEDVGRTQIHGIVLVTPWRKKGNSPPYHVNLTDGSRIVGSSIWKESSELVVGVAPGVELRPAWSSVTRIGIQSPRLAYLSDLDPKLVKAKPILSLSREWARDRSVTFGAMAIKGAVYEKGIGMAAGSRLDFDCSDFDRFIGSVGIDLSAGGRGDCIFVARIDGEEIFRKRVRGDAAAFPLNLTLNGARTLSLIVEPGVNLDLSDYANWANASLVKTR